MYRCVTRLAVLAAAMGLAGMRVPAQVLARPGWAGSGVAPAAWWRRAVFYRIRPVQFQDSDGDGRGDLRGLTARLDYVRSLGVDAIVLDELPGPAAVGAGGRSDGNPDRPKDAGTAVKTPDDLGDFLQEASRHQLRVLFTVTAAMQGGDRAVLLQTVRGWMNEGGAGVLLPKAQPTNAADEAGYDALATTLRALLRPFPGGRVLLAEASRVSAESDPRTHGQRRADVASGLRAEASGVLTMAAALPVEAPRAEALRGISHALADERAPERLPLLRFAGDPRTADAAIAATLLLGLRGAAIFSFGEEIGLDTSPAMLQGRQVNEERPAGKGIYAPVMQWTPLNIQQAPIERPEPRTESLPGVSAIAETQFGAYHAYIHPPPGSLTGPTPAPPRAVVDGNLPAALADPNTLPGFTTESLPNPPVGGAQLNVEAEERDPHSLLQAYRQLVALHHDHATMREGAVIPLAPAVGGEDVVAWVRRAPAGARTADVLAVVNLGTAPVVLSLDRELTAVAVRPGRLRPLFSWSREALTGESTEVLRLPAHAVFVGELVGERAR